MPSIFLMSALITGIIGGAILLFGLNICKDDQFGFVGVTVGLPSLLIGGVIVAGSLVNNEIAKSTDRQDIATIKQQLNDALTLLNASRQSSSS